MRHQFTRADLLPEGLPPANEVVEQGKDIAKGIAIGQTLFMREHGVTSEAEYKRKMRGEGRVMYHAHFGLGSWPQCQEGLKRIYEGVSRRGARVDRFGVCLARTMGLPPEMRAKVPRETGLVLSTPEEWIQIGQAVPIQPHFGDHIIGTPASVSNLVCVLEAGGTTVGNLAHYFSYDYPGWTDQIVRTLETVRALGIMAQLRDKGIVLHSNLCDGPGSILDDRANYIGWAMLEKYIVEDLIGAELVHCFGNTITDPETRLSVLLALDEIHGGETAGSMIVGNTMYTEDPDRNLAVLGSYLLSDIIGQLKRPTGHAVEPVPLTEHD
ncbi:MAG TPA: hypothetical protein G4O03_07350 [Dehalococcoidia bacterium]|nr:hypothetical protein [Dehalococcoidia bacterium]